MLITLIAKCLWVNVIFNLKIIVNIKINMFDWQCWTATASRRPHSLWTLARWKRPTAAAWTRSRPAQSWRRIPVRRTPAWRRASSAAGNSRRSAGWAAPRSRTRPVRAKRPCRRRPGGRLLGTRPGCWTPRTRLVTFRCRSVSGHVERSMVKISYEQVTGVLKTNINCFCNYLEFETESNTYWYSYWSEYLLCISITLKKEKWEDSLRLATWSVA